MSGGKKEKLGLLGFGVDLEFCRPLNLSSEAKPESLLAWKECEQVWA